MAHKALTPVEPMEESTRAQIPRLLAPDPRAARYFLEFFAANIRSPNTRRAYLRKKGPISRDQSHYS